MEKQFTPGAEGIPPAVAGVENAGRLALL